MHASELNDIGMQQAMQMFALLNWIRCIYVWFIRYIKQDEIYAGLLDVEQGGFGLCAYRTKCTACSPTWRHKGGI